MNKSTISARFGVSAACDILCRRNMHSVTISAGVSVFFTLHYFCSCDKHNGKTKYIGITAWWEWWSGGGGGGGGPTKYFVTLNLS